MERLETKRVVLREWTLEDAEDLFSYAKSEVVGPMAGWKPHESVEESRDIIKMFQKQGETWALYLKEEGRVVGSVGLHNEGREDTRMLGYVLGEAYWGRGITLEASVAVLTYAFESLHLDKVTVYHFPFNQQSKRVIEKLGFTYDGLKEMGSRIFDGTVYDDVCYSMTKNDFEALYRKERDV